jgi:ABC-type branched-subunit amino acid transport system permease subunit
MNLSVSLDTVVLGVIVGLTYGVLGIGLTLIYKSARFVNFAHGNLGAFAAVIFGKLVLDWGIPFWISFVLALAVAAALAAAVELTVIRRLFDSPRLVLVVATIAIAQLVLFAALQRGLQADQNVLIKEGYPTAFSASFQVGSLTLTGGHIGILVVVPLLALALAAFFRFSAYGQAIRASADNADAARLAGISVKRMSTLVWVIAGVLAAATAILLAPQKNVFEIGSLGPGILVRALGASLIGRMTSLPITFLAGIAIGVVETIAFDSFTSGGIQDLVVFMVLMGALAFRARGLSRVSRDVEAPISFGAETRPLPRAIAALPAVRRLRSLGVVGAVAVAVALPLLPLLDLSTSEKTFRLTLVAGYCIVGISLTILTGWAGQVSLGQFAIVGVGAFAAARFAGDLPFPLLVLACGTVGAAVAVLIGLPAVRIQGLFLAVSTLAFAVVATAWAFQQEVFVGSPSGVSIRRPDFLRTERASYWFAIVLVALCALAARNLRRSGPGRALLAVRDNDRSARSGGLSAAGTRLLGFAIAGFMAAVAGVVFAYGRGNFTAIDFDPSRSLDMLLMVIIGGLGSIPGAILGAVFLFGTPILLGSSEIARLATSAVGVLVVLLFLPGGLVSLVHRVRDVLIDRIVRKEHGLPPPPRLIPPLRDVARVALGRASAPQRPTVPGPSPSPSPTPQDVPA